MDVATAKWRAAEAVAKEAKARIPQPPGLTELTAMVPSPRLGDRGVAGTGVAGTGIAGTDIARTGVTQTDARAGAGRAGAIPATGSSPDLSARRTDRAPAGGATATDRSADHIAAEGRRPAATGDGAGADFPQRGGVRD